MATIVIPGGTTGPNVLVRAPKLSLTALKIADPILKLLAARRLLSKSVCRRRPERSMFSQTGLGRSFRSRKISLRGEDRVIGPRRHKVLRLTGSATCRPACGLPDGRSFECTRPDFVPRKRNGPTRCDGHWDRSHLTPPPAWRRKTGRQRERRLRVAQQQIYSLLPPFLVSIPANGDLINEIEN
jgi:hypothetical protein